MLQPPVLYIKLHGKSSTLGTFKTKKKKERKVESGSEKSKGGMKREKKTVTIQFHKVFFSEKKCSCFSWILGPYTFQPTLKFSRFLRLERKKKIRKMGKEKKMKK